MYDFYIFARFFFFLSETQLYIFRIVILKKMFINILEYILRCVMESCLTIWFHPHDTTCYDDKHVFVWNGGIQCKPSEQCKSCAVRCMMVFMRGSIIWVQACNVHIHKSQFTRSLLPHGRTLLVSLTHWPPYKCATRRWVYRILYFPFIRKAYKTRCMTGNFRNLTKSTSPATCPILRATLCLREPQSHFEPRAIIILILPSIYRIGELREEFAIFALIHSNMYN